MSILAKHHHPALKESFMEKQFPTHIVAAFGIVENENGEILLLKSRGHDVWMFPGGQVEIGENLYVVVRETKEEADMDITVQKLFCVTSTPAPIRVTTDMEQSPPKWFSGSPAPISRASSALPTRPHRIFGYRKIAYWTISSHPISLKNTAPT